MHPAVFSALRQNDDAGLAQVWKAGARAGSPVCALLARLSGTALDDDGFRSAIAGEPEADLVRFARLDWGYRLYLRDRLDEAAGLADQVADGVRDDGNGATWLAARRWLLGIIAHRRGDHETAGPHLRTAWDLAPDDTWLWRSAGLFLAQDLRHTERGVEAAAVVERLERRHPGYAPAGPDLTMLVDAAGCGRVSEAWGLCDRLGGTLVHPDALGAYAFSRALIDLMATALPGPWTPPRRSAEEDRRWLLATAGVDIADYLVTTHRLLAGDAAGARSAAEAYLAGLGPGGRRCIRFDLYDLVRARLATRDPDGAEAELEALRSARGEHHWDAFFRARVDLLRGDGAGAERRMAALAAEAHALDSTARLRFELLLAIEVPVPVAGRWLLATGAPPATPAAPGGAPAAAARLVGPSPALADIRRLIARFAALDLPVLVTGETGTGKELAARALHESGPRRERPFLAVNCGAISGSLLAAELFGCARGAYTGAVERDGLFAAAGDGTLLLDEIGEIGPELQAALLRVLENGEFLRVGSAAPQRARCRIIAATNRDLDRAVLEGRMRADLVHRLRHLRLHIPPLRARREDIMPLAQHLLARDGGPAPRISGDLAAVLAARPWPGNGRELRNTLDLLRAIAGARPRLERSDLAAVEPADGPDPLPERPPEAWREERGGDRRTGREGILRRHLAAEGRITAREAARLLGVSRPTATRMLRACCAEGSVVKVMPNGSPASHWFRWTGPQD